MADKNKTDNLEILPSCATEYIRLVIKKMRYRRKVRREVQAELAAHFEDELKDCPSAEEKEKKARELIEQFGDAKLLGKLLRRAKKRCRPLWRTIFARLCQAVVLLFIFLVIYIAWFLSGKPVITKNYVEEANRIVRPTADDSLNAAPIYDEAIKLYEKAEGNDIRPLLEEKKYLEATEEERRLVSSWLAENQQIFNLVEEGTKKPYYWRQFEGKEMINILIPNLSGLRQLARSLRWRAYLNAEKGKYQLAFSDIKLCYRMGQQLKGNRTIIEQLVGIAIRAVAVDTICNILSSHSVGSSELAVLHQDFEQMIDDDFAFSFKTEKLMIYDEIQRCFTDGLFGSHLYLARIFELGDTFSNIPTKKSNELYDLIRMLFSSVKEGNLLNAAEVLFAHPGKEQTREMADEFYDFWENVGRKTPAEVNAEGIDFEEKTSEMVKGNVFLHLLTPAFGKIHELSYRIKVHTNATLAIIALLRYKQDKGNLPDNLDELVSAGYLKNLPMDPWSDRPLIYKKQGNDFILYGVGSNFVDDNGEVDREEDGKIKQFSEKGDWVFWPVQKEG